MEFNGFVNMDFDFFRKKDKLSSEDYDNARNNLKTHFRGMCYEFQKMYFKNTGNFFDMEKEFQNFNKRSTSINAAHIIKSNDLKLNFELNSDGMYIEIALPTSGSLGALDYLIKKKDALFNFIMGNRFRVVKAYITSKSKELSCIKLSGYDISEKNYEVFIKNLQNNLKSGKQISKLTLGYYFNKVECTKQGKNLINSVYDSVIGILSVADNIK